MVTPLPLAAAQSDEEGRVTVWTEPQHVTTFMEIAENDTLIIRGDPAQPLTVTFDEGIYIAPGGKLILDTNVVIQSDGDGWRIDNRGRMEVRGEPQAPVILDGLSGSGQSSGDTILFTGGLLVEGGQLEARHLVLRNYTSGLKSGWNASVVLEDVSFESARGLGLVASQGLIEAERLRFRGAGAGYWAVANGWAIIRNTTFEQPGPLAIAVNGNTTILENVRILNATGTCLRNTVGRLEVRGLECTGFQADGIIISRPVKGFRMPDAHLSGVRLSTDSPNATAAIGIARAPDHFIENVEIGPVPRAGIVGQGTTPRIANATFHGVGQFNVLVLNPSTPVEPKQIGNGTSGGDGWLFVGYPVSARIVDAAGAPLEGAVFMGQYNHNESLAFTKITPESGLTSSSYLPVTIVDPEGQVQRHTYDLRAYHPLRGGDWNRTDYVPDGDMLIIQLEAGEIVDNRNLIPGPSALLVAVALAGALVLARRARAR